jgi:type II secretory pathway component GspD/PulD (secretin)
MKTRIATLALLGLSLIAPAIAQESQPPMAPATVAVDSNGSDVRAVLHKLFTQTGKNFLVDPGAYYSLYLNLTNVTFDTAVEVICRNAGLDYTIEEGGIYHFFKPKTAKSQVAAPTVEPTAKPLDASVLNIKVSTRLQGAEIRKVLQELSAQSGVPIEVSPEVKALRVNAMLVDTSLRYALNSITQAAKLAYSFTPKGTILVSDPTLAASAQSNTAAITAKPTCDQCKASLEKGWKYCPICGNYVKPITK